MGLTDDRICDEKIHAACLNFGRKVQAQTIGLLSTRPELEKTEVPELTAWVDEHLNLTEILEET